MTGSKAHSARKRMLSNIYSKSVLQSSPHLRVISRTIVVDRLLPILAAAALRQTPVDVHDLNQGLTMDFVSAYLFGGLNGTNFLQDESLRRSMLQIYQSRKPFEFYYQEVPSLLSWAKTLGIPILPKWYYRANAVLDEWALGMCDQADQACSSTDPAVEPAVYKQLKQAMAKQQPVKADDPESCAEALRKRRLDIACEMYDHLTAGHETSAVALTYLFWELSKQPTMQRELRDELLTLTPRVCHNSCTDPSVDELPSPKSIDSLPLLDAIVTETLRLHAPIPGIQPRVTPYPVCELAGYGDIPAQTRVNAQAYSLHRNPDVFPDPETWQPLRWLKPAEAASFDEMHRWFWAFGSGGRMCVGSNLALQGKRPLFSFQ